MKKKDDRKHICQVAIAYILINNTEKFNSEQQTFSNIAQHTQEWQKYSVYEENLALSLFL